MGSSAPTEPLQKNTSLGPYCSSRPSTSWLVAHRKLQAGGRGRRFGLGEEPCPSKQDGHNPLQPQGATATNLSVGTANKTSVDVPRASKSTWKFCDNKKTGRKGDLHDFTEGKLILHELKLN